MDVTDGDANAASRSHSSTSGCLETEDEEDVVERGVVFWGDTDWNCEGDAALVACIPENETEGAERPTDENGVGDGGDLENDAD